MNKLHTLVAASMTLAVIGAVAATYILTTNHRITVMAKDVQSAIDKGVNPIVIRCAYANENDQICLVYTASRGGVDRVEMKTPVTK